MKTLLLAAVFALTPMAALACEGQVSVCDGAAAGSFSLVKGGAPATVYVDAGAEKPVLRVAEDFADDLQRVSGKRPAVVHSLDGVTGDVVVIAQDGHSPLVEQLTSQRLVDFRDAGGKWEAYQQSVIGLDGRHVLLVLGADPRGAVYGTYDISARMGVSPWYWWADVPVAHKDDLYVTAGARTDAPKVKYRGFFINDEEPAFGGWAREKFGGINHLAYEKVFELDLRLKGNYLWPAMWGKSIADDDPESLKTADEYGIVLGTSHHEPMTRAQEEWHRHTDQGITGGKWDYTTNAGNLRAFWRGGIERMVTCSSSDSGSTTKKCHHENVVTVGMRGDGDEPMSEGTATALLEQIVADQRQIIADVTGKPAEQTPQVWALYKEVQDYYDHGMKVPDDVTLLFADDNWGQIRRLPASGAPKRAGGYGVYYHFDYVGGPRNYKWINTNQIEKTWQQMDLAWEAGVDRLWIVNVGDIKPMEYPLSFFMDMAWNPDAMTPDALQAYPYVWAEQQFGHSDAFNGGDILTRLERMTSRRKPELLTPDTYSLANYGEIDRIMSDCKALVDDVNLTSTFIGSETRNAWAQLVVHPALAGCNLLELNRQVALNRWQVASASPWAPESAGKAREAFARDAELSAMYNQLNDGKWNHMMDQTHIGYDNWQQPETNVMPAVVDGTTATAERTAFNKAPKIATCPFGGPEACGYIAFEAEHYARKVEGGNVSWLTVPDLGRTLSSVISYPQAAPATMVKDGVRLEYDVTLKKAADTVLNLYLAPTLDTQGQGGLKIAAAIDDGAAQTLGFDLQPNTPDWNKAVSDNIVVLKAAFPGLKAGRHTIKIFRIDGNVVLERVVLDTGGMLPTYLGPPETPAP